MDEEDLRQRLTEEPLLDAVQKFFDEKFGISGSSDKKVIEDLTLNGLLDHWKKNKFKKIVTIVGAGISTSAGIPDFRSPGSGLYDNLQKYDLPHPTSIFDMDYFLKKPEPFFALAKELYPGKFKPTPAHYFVRMLHENGLLVRHYTQNIDTLERVAGIPKEKLVEAHGTFYTNHCLGCREVYTMEWMKEQIFADKLPTCSSCQALVKPDIVFFGESMPEEFFTMPRQDFKNCDLLIIMGTSLEVQPFASLIDQAGPECMRLLINRDKVGLAKDSWFAAGPRLMYDSPGNTRDVAFIGDCDEGVFKIADALGWGKSLQMMIRMDYKRIEQEEKGFVPPIKKLVEPKAAKEKVKSTTVLRGEESEFTAAEIYEKPTSPKPDENAA